MAGSTEENYARSVLLEIKGRLNAIQSAEDCAKIIKDINSSLFTSHGHYLSNSVKSREIYLEKYYGNTIEQLLGLAKKSWFPRYKKTYSEDFESFFKNGPAKDVFFSLNHVLNKEKHTNVIKECVQLLENYAKLERYAEMFWDQAKVLPLTSQGRTFYDPSVQTFWDEIIKAVISLPDRVSNIYKLRDGSVLWPVGFFKMIGKMIVKVLKMVHEAISASTDCSIGFLSQIFAKVCIRNHADDIYSVILPEVEKLVICSPLWSRICQKLFSSIDEPSLDAVIQPLLMKCKSYQMIYQLLGDFTKEKRSHLKYLMTHKYLLYRHYKMDMIPYCIMGYVMKCSSNDFDILTETLQKLLDAWGNINGIKHTSYAHHLYITKCILIAIGFLRQNYGGKGLPEKLGRALTMKLLDSLPPHLESPIDKFRNLGMIVAEEITKASRVKDIEPLKFEFQRDSDALYLSSIAEDPFLIERAVEENKQVPEMPSAKIEDTNEDSDSLNSGKTTKESVEESDLDSDDDLEPYPMDEEDENNVLNGVRPPVYISECISGLLSKDDPSRLEACLAVAEKLIRREPPELPELAVELVKVLLYLQDNYNTKHFISYRHGAMVAATVQCPKNVIAYLTKEFYEENYNLRQRMDILEVISSSAQELSRPIDTHSKSIHKHLPLPTIPGITSKEKPEWQVIVEERIKSKTRMISHGRKNPLPSVVANKFSAVAGDFFFPLLKDFDSKCRTFDLLGQDFIVLGKLIQTLGTVIHASSGLSITRMMTSAMLDFVWGLRYHGEAFVRQALLYATCMCVLACPTSILITDLNSELMESHQWVTDVSNSDPSTECRQLAMQTLFLLDQVFKRHFDTSR